MEFNYDYDKENMRGVLLNIVKQIKEGLVLGEGIQLKKRPAHIHIQGIGGSSLPGSLLRDYLAKENINLTTSRGFNAPKNISNDTLSFILSYSGNTEETISAYREIRKTEAKIIVITSGGKLKDLAKMNENKIIQIPSGVPPRQATSYMFFPVLQILQENQIISNRADEIKSVIDVVSKDSYERIAQDLASRIAGKIPLIYSSLRLSVVADKWKIGFNENSKTPSFTNTFPAVTHVEINSFINMNSSFFAIIIRDDEEYQGNSKQMKALKETLKDHDVDVTEIMLRGDFLLTKIFMGMYMADWVSYYLALIYKTDPSPVKVVEDFKKKLKKMTRL